MTIDPVSGYSSAPDMQTLRNMETNQNRVQQQAQNQDPVDRQTFGAAVVAKTLDYMNGQGSSAQDAAPVDKQTFGAAVVSKTLDYMNAGQGHDNGMAQNYDFQKSVLGGHAAELGALANVKV